MAESRFETSEPTNTNGNKKPVTVVSQPKKQLSTKALPPVPDAEPSIVINVDDKKENPKQEAPKHMLKVPASLVNGTKQTNGDEHFPEMLGGKGLEKSQTTVKPKPPTSKPVYGKKSPKKEKSKSVEPPKEATNLTIDPNSQYLLTFGDEADNESRWAKYKPKCMYILKEIGIGLDATILKPLAAFPMGYGFSEFDLFKNPVVNPGFAGYAIHNLLEILGEHKKDGLKMAVKNKSKLKQLAFVGSAGLITSALTQHFFPVQYNSVEERSLNVALPGAAMGLASHVYDRYISRTEKMPRSYLTHFAQKVIMVGLNTVQAVGFSMFYHELATELKYQNNDASSIFSLCVLEGLVSMTALKLFDLIRFKVYLTPKEQAQEIYDKGNIKRIRFPEVLGYALMSLSYVIANSIDTMGFNWKINHCFETTTAEVATKAAKLMSIYGAFRLGSEWYLDRRRRKMLADAQVDARTSLISGGDLEANRTAEANRVVLDDEDPITTGGGYKPPSSARNIQ